MVEDNRPASLKTVMGKQAYHYFIIGHLFPGVFWSTPLASSAPTLTYPPQRGIYVSFKPSYFHHWQPPFVQLQTYVLIHIGSDLRNLVPEPTLFFSSFPATSEEDWIPLTGFSDSAVIASRSSLIIAKVTS